MLSTKPNLFAKWISKPTWFVLSIILSSQVSLAQQTKPAASNQSTTTKSFTPSLSGSLAVSYGRNLVDQQNGTLNQELSYSSLFNTRISKEYTLRFTVDYTSSLVDSSYDDFGDSSIALIRSPIEISNSWLLGSSITALLPTSKASSKRDNMISLLRIGANLILKPEVLPSWKITVGVSGGPNFYQYETNINGSVLSKSSLSESLTITKEIGRTALTGNFRNINTWTQTGYMKQSFSHTETIYYSLTNDLGVSIGHTNQGSVLKADGHGSNIALINENSSMIFVETSYVF